MMTQAQSQINRSRTWPWEHPRVGQTHTSRNGKVTVLAVTAEIVQAHSVTETGEPQVDWYDRDR